MRAAERKSATNGALKVFQPSCPEDLDAYLDRGFLLQSNGWKGREGSAIMQNEEARTFYKTLAAKGLEAGWLRYMLLAGNGDDMSFMYCLGAFGAIHALEIGMDERFRGMGAGMVVTKKMLEQVFAERRFDTWDFGEGRDRWKKDWSTARELKYNVFIFPKNPLGMIYHAFARYYHNRHPFRPYGAEEDAGDGAKGPKEGTP
jgi:CelD/BcsL family acetyltransferase involved in cellulose biosynthesis